MVKDRVNPKLSAPNTIRKRGLEALAKALGPVDMVRFLQQFDMGSGNYTEERDTWLKNLDVKTIVTQIQGSREKIE